MRQKTAWITYLIIGGISTFIFSCEKEIGEPIQKANYVYVNKLSETVRFELHNIERNSSIEYDIEEGDSLVFAISGTPGAFPFHGNEASNRTGDSIIFRFGNGTCTNYKRDKSTGTFSGTGVFDLTQYKNYTTQLVNEKSYTLRYEIDEKDAAVSKSCE